MFLKRKTQRRIAESGPRLVVESLEARNFLAADLFDRGVFNWGQFDIGLSIPEVHSELSQSKAVELVTPRDLVGEGEPPADDLVGFATALRDAGVELFCADWLEACTQQRELLRDGGKFLPFIEVTNSDRSANHRFMDKGLTTVPTWDFQNGIRATGMLSVAQISALAGIAIPQSSTPSFATIGDRAVGIGSPLHLPVDAYDPNGDPLTVTVVSSDPAILQAQVLAGNRSLALSVLGYGDMVFELFEGRAPVPAERVIALAESGFYNNTSFHRVIADFVIQGGDRTGTGLGGSTLGRFDDQYHLDLQHNASGMLSYAKSSDDTNDSQFFVTAQPLRYLDFNHSVFGILVEGDETRLAIERTITNNADRPLFPATIETASIIEDNENSVVLLKPTGAGTGIVSVTIKVADIHGNEFSETLDVAVGLDSANGAPFLNPIPIGMSCANHTANLQLTAQDKEGDQLLYSVGKLGGVDFGIEVDAQTGLVTVVPPQGFSGELQFLATVRQSSASTTSSVTDNQVVRILFSSTHQNTQNILDVNAGGTVTATDVLLVINHLNSDGAIHTGSLPAGAPFLDVNGDCTISPIDVLLVINALNANGEGESYSEGSSGLVGQLSSEVVDSFLVTYHGMERAEEVSFHYRQASETIAQRTVAGLDEAAHPRYGALLTSGAWIASQQQLNRSDKAAGGAEEAAMERFASKKLFVGIDLADLERFRHLHLDRLFE